MSSPSDFLIASSRKPLVGNSSELSIRGAQGAQRPKWFSPRASAAPPPVVGSAGRVVERDFGGVDGQEVV